MLLLTLAHSFFKKSSKAKNPYIQFRQIFRCAQQHVHIRRTLSCWYISLLRSHKANVLSDLQSDSIKYKDFQSAIHIYKLEI